jgi:hypothetical protein
MAIDTSKFKTRNWKEGVLPPEDATRPRCKVLYSYDGINGTLDEDETDLVDWLIVIGYEAKEN